MKYDLSIFNEIEDTDELPDYESETIDEVLAWEDEHGEHDVISLFRIEMLSDLYDKVQDWYDGMPEWYVRGYYEHDGYMYFVAGYGYALIERNLLGCSYDSLVPEDEYRQFFVDFCNGAPRDEETYLAWCESKDAAAA